jgi:hypothetical protein
MKRNIAILISLFVVSLYCYSQTPATQTTATDMMGKSCDQILSMSSSQWMDQYSASKGDSGNWIAQGLAVYGSCYDQRTAALQNSLNQKGTGPLMGGMGNLHDMQAALQNFTNLALQSVSGGGTYDQIRAAYAMLYQKQFPYLFFQEYENPDQQNPGTSDSGSLDQAKERLGELIARHKSEQESLQDAFDTLQTAAVDACGIPPLTLYQYAIGLLQSPSDPPYAPPPF